MVNFEKSIALLKKLGICSVSSLLFLITAEASIAANLVNGGTDEDAFLSGDFSEGNPITKIGEVEGIAGGSSKELFFGINGSSTATPQSSTDFSWQNGTEYDWTLNWNPTTNEAIFTVDSPFTTINYTFAPTTLDQLNAFGLIAKTDGRDVTKVEAGTTINLSVDTIDFSDGTNATVTSNSVSSTAVSGTQIFDKQFYVLEESDRANNIEITKMTGSFSLDWNTLNPQAASANSRVGFELKLFDPPATSATATPEPGSIISLFVLGVLGLSHSKGKNQ